MPGIYSQGGQLSSQSAAVLHSAFLSFFLFMLAPSLLVVLFLAALVSAADFYKILDGGVHCLGIWLIYADSRDVLFSAQVSL